jgi:hypothetical protein
MMSPISRLGQEPSYGKATTGGDLPDRVGGKSRAPRVLHRASFGERGSVQTQYAFLRNAIAL